uniref:RNA-directed DNA polymerase, eukaryota n=1 Tax=Tanacetum cinerariifolium TaxID=118510 RepID=A0A6L2KUR1_TANCI|nr:RNA-directed DNA polymerase, eukaryota [Tanacetum cinerariifolium]
MAGRNRSNEDNVRSISKSIFITNFSDSTTSADLWKLCQAYGSVVDVFIPNRRWHLHANVARFDRPPVQNSWVPPTSRSTNATSSYVSVVKGVLNPLLSVLPGMVIDDTCVVTRDLGNHVMGEIKEFSSINKLHILLSNEGFSNVKISYLGGMWVMIELSSSTAKDNFLKHIGVASWFKCLLNAQADFVSHERIVWVDIEGIPLHAWSRNTFLKIGAKWGKVLDLEEGKDDFFARKRICIKTKQEYNILEKFKIIVKGKVFVVRDKELFTWSPFCKVQETDYSSDDELAKDEGINQFEPSQQVNFEEESDDEVVSNTHFGDNMEKEGTSNESVINSGANGNSEDPFKIYDLLNKSKKVVETIDSDTSISFPPGFTHNLKMPKEDEQHLNMGTVHSPCGSSGCSSRILEGIMCAWDHIVFCKEHHTISDNFIAVFGTWIPTKMKVMLISVYAPQVDSYKRDLWSYLELLVNRWNGESIITGDFNEVRRKEERWGSTFIVHGARVFNNFISNAGLVDLQLEGYSFTWSHPSASKMSKLDRFLVTDGLLSSFPHILAVCLDRHLSDHRPILLREVFTDFGATPFRLYHSWFSFQGFDHSWFSFRLYHS